MSVHDPTAGRVPDGASIVWQQDDGRWRWRWTADPDGGDDDHQPLVSNETYDSLDEACSSAQEAYPGSVLRRPETRTEQRHRRRHHRELVAALVGAGLLVVVRRKRRE